jgi:hypothetical protein
LVGADGKKATLQLNKLFPEETPAPIDVRKLNMFLLIILFLM